MTWQTHITFHIKELLKGTQISAQLLSKKLSQDKEIFSLIGEQTNQKTDKSNS